MPKRRAEGGTAFDLMVTLPPAPDGYQWLVTRDRVDIGLTGAKLYVHLIADLWWADVPRSVYRRTIDVDLYGECALEAARAILEDFQRIHRAESGGNIAQLWRACSVTDSDA